MSSKKEINAELNLYYNLESVLKESFQNGIVFLDSSVIISRLSLLELLRVEPFSRDKFVYLKQVNLKLSKFFLDLENFYILPGVQNELIYGIKKAEEKQKALLETYGDKHLKHINATLHYHRELVNSFNVFDFNGFLGRNSKDFPLSEIEVQQTQIINGIIPKVPRKNGRFVSRVDVNQVVLAMQIAKYTNTNIANVSADVSDFTKILRVLVNDYRNLSFHTNTNYGLVKFPKNGKRIERVKLGDYLR